MGQQLWALPERQRIQEDFDRIAELTGDSPNSNHFHFAHLEKSLPQRCVNALEIGCGVGGFTRVLAKHAEKVAALDLSPKMIELARQRSQSPPNIDYQLADVMEWEIPKNHFDCIVSVATLHHLPTSIFPKMASGLKPGGTLVVLDLRKDETLLDNCRSALALVVNPFMRWRYLGRSREPLELRRAWNAHGKRDSYLTMREVGAICRQYLPGAKLHKHFLWRYSLVWNKPVR